MRSIWRPAALGALLALVVVWATAIGGEGRARSAGDFYGAIEAAAAEGDRSAQALKQDLDDYLASTGLTIAELMVPEMRSVALHDGPSRLRVEDASPWQISVEADPALDTVHALEAYRAMRQAAVDDLAVADPLRPIEAAITPRSEIAVATLAERINCSCKVSRIIVDVWGPDGWLMSSGRVFSEIDLITGAESIERELIGQADISLGQFALPAGTEIHISVRQLVVTLSAAEARRLSGHADVYAVDPTTDLADAFAGRAASVVVGTPPDLYLPYQELVLRRVVAPAHEPILEEYEK